MVFNTIMLNVTPSPILVFGMQQAMPMPLCVQVLMLTQTARMLVLGKPHPGVQQAMPMPLCVQVLTSTQTARMLVQSYPWLPDMTSITSWVAFDLGDTSVIQTLSCQQPTSWPLAEPKAPIRFLRDL